MSSHANCTHEKTKAARAACRAGKLGEASDVREAAPKAEREDPMTRHYEPADDFVRKGNICGPCGNGHHDRCPEGGKQWFCTCLEADHTL